MMKRMTAGDPAVPISAFIKPRQVKRAVRRRHRRSPPRRVRPPRSGVAQPAAMAKIDDHENEDKGQHVDDKRPPARAGTPHCVGSTGCEPADRATVRTTLLVHEGSGEEHAGDESPRGAGGDGYPARLPGSTVSAEGGMSMSTRRWP